MKKQINVFQPNLTNSFFRMFQVVITMIKDGFEY